MKNFLIKFLIIYLFSSFSALAKVSNEVKVLEVKTVGRSVIVDNNFKWDNFTITEQDKILDSKRSNNFLDTTKLESLYPDVLNIKDAVNKMLLKYNL